MSIEFRASGRFGTFDLDAAFKSEGRLTALFGRSGAGKTTIVNCIAGLVRPASARIVVDGVVLTDTEARIDVPVHERRIGYVFQDGRLFPHLSVAGNLRYGRLFGTGKESGPGLDAVVALLGLEPLLSRRTGKLSGGERQRVAIGRALLSGPRLLLLDEPLSSLDDARKREVMPYLERLRDEARIPVVYVSHSVAEVARLATTLVLIEDGRAVASGPTASLLSRLDLGLGSVADAGAVLEGRIAAHDTAAGLTEIETGAGRLLVPRLDRPEGARMRARIRARDVMIATRRPEALSALNIIEGKVAEIGESHGPVVEIALDCGTERLLARLTLFSVRQLGLAPGAQVYAVVKSITFDEENTGRAPDVAGSG